ncbi:GNAT family N-acetyltransferase [Chitinivorax sp. B]|uniref:GNAT family N-acetyltransferase n=1 Tax=Chitinivorax sp. B TaxID=2502235 RepID=UPI0010F82C44|nr:GNAT family N-acetyltransferase [Chitinivorax sp. B]
MSTLTIRPATEADAGDITRVFTASRREYLPYAPLKHSDESIQQWLTQQIRSAIIMVAMQDTRIVGFYMLNEHAEGWWLDQLYLLPDVTGQGIGSTLLAHAMNRAGRPLMLYTFADNHGARRFYERHGFVAIRYGDGSDNEEGVPDVCYWLA